LTVEDRKKFSLRAGATAAGVPAVAGSIPGDRMSESEMFNEIGGGKRVKVIAIAGIAVAAVVAVLFFTMKGKGPDKAAVPPSAPTAATKAAEEPPAVAPVPAAKAPEAPAAAAAAPTEEAEPPHAKEAAPAHETPPAVAKARSPKRKAAKRTSGKKKH
jgi:type IV secretory pathway VirB10-like protein